MKSLTRFWRCLLCLGAVVSVAVGVRAVTGTHAACVPPGRWATPQAGTADVQPSAQVLARLARQQVVLLGESHENPEHHRWQLHTVSGLHALRPDLVLGFEMFPRRVQPVLDRWTAGELRAEEFLARSEWAKVWGYEAALYLPLFHFARMNRLPMLALNVERSLVSRVGDEGWAAIPPDQREGVTDPAAASPEYLRLLHASFRDHHHGGPAAAGAPKGPTDADLAEPRFRRFVEGQQVWDRAMAQRIAERARGGQAPLVIGILGSGHVRQGHGVPHQLRDLGVTAVASALPWDESAPCAGLQAGVADVVYGTDPPPPPASRPRLGIAVGADPNGVRVREVTPGSPAERAGLRAGDLITQAAGDAVRDPADVIAIVRRQPAGTILPLQVMRGEQSLEILARFPAQP
jgi:uncharacterized iron-regulated protein